MVEIKALIDGKVGTIFARLTEAEVTDLTEGGQLVIKRAEGNEYPVENTKK